MKTGKILLLITITLLFTSCGNDTDDEKEQDYTSFFFKNTGYFSETVVGYQKDGLYYKLAEFGFMAAGEESPEIILKDNSITEVYMFFDAIPADKPLKIERFKKNELIYTFSTASRPVDKDDPTQFPQ